MSFRWMPNSAWPPGFRFQNRIVIGRMFAGRMRGCGPDGRRHCRTSLAIRLIRTAPPPTRSPRQEARPPPARRRPITNGRESRFEESHCQVPNPIRTPGADPRFAVSPAQTQASERRDDAPCGCDERARSASDASCRSTAKMRFSEGCGLGRKHFENSVDPTPALNRQHRNRSANQGCGRLPHRPRIQPRYPAQC